MVRQIICIFKNEKEKFPLVFLVFQAPIKLAILETALFFLPTHHWRNHAHNESSLVELALSVDAALQNPSGNSAILPDYSQSLGHLKKRARSVVQEAFPSKLAQHFA